MGHPLRIYTLPNSVNRLISLHNLSYILEDIDKITIRIANFDILYFHKEGNKLLLFFVLYLYLNETVLVTTKYRIFQNTKQKKTMLNVQQQQETT